MERYRTTERPVGCHTLEVYACPAALIERAIDLASDVVTVENFRPARTHEWHELTLQLHPEDRVGPRRIRAAVFDVTMGREEFRSHLAHWDVHGVYAVFTRGRPLPFRASDMPDAARYRALANLGWTLELAIPDAAGGEWGSISSPDRGLIERLCGAAAEMYGGWSGGKLGVGCVPAWEGAKGCGRRA